MARTQMIAILVASVCLLVTQSQASDHDSHEHHGAGCPKKMEDVASRQRRQADSSPLDQVQAGWKSATDFLGNQAKSAQESIQKSWDSLNERPKREGDLPSLSSVQDSAKSSNPLDQVQAGWKSATEFLGEQAKSAQESVQKSWDSLTRPKREGDLPNLSSVQDSAKNNNPLDQVQAGWKSATEYLGNQAKSAQESVQKSWDSLTRPKREGDLPNLSSVQDSAKSNNPLDQVQAGWKSATEFLGEQAKSAQESVQKSWDSLTRPKRQSNSNPLEGLQAGIQSLQSIQSLGSLLKPQPQGPPQSIDQTLPEAINREAASGGQPFSPTQIMGALNTLVRSSQEGGQKMVESGQQSITQTQSGITAAFREIGEGLKKIAERNPSLLPDVKELYSNVAGKLSSSSKQTQTGGLIPNSASDQLGDNLAKAQAPGFQPTA